MQTLIKLIKARNCIFQSARYRQLDPRYGSDQEKGKTVDFATERVALADSIYLQILSASI